MAKKKSKLRETLETLVNEIDPKTLLPGYSMYNAVKKGTHEGKNIAEKVALVAENYIGAGISTGFEASMLISGGVTGYLLGALPAQPWEVLFRSSALLQAITSAHGQAQFSED